jgi:cytosine/adenosine deaminase-related metal-dependent hydrolase
LIRYHARWVLPVTAAPFENGTVVEHAGRITWVGPREAAPPGEDRDLGDVALLPGLINAHTHLELTAMRGMLEGLEFPRWIAGMRESRDWLFSGDVALDSARLGVVEALQAGITTVADTTPTGRVAYALSEAGLRGIVFQETFGPDPARCEAMMDELRDRVNEIRRLESPLLSIGVSPHAPYTVSDQLYEAVARYAREQGLPIAAHIAESAAETELVSAGTGAFADALRRRGIAVEPRARTPVELLQRRGLLGSDTLLIHCVDVDERDIATIAGSDARVVHCPVANARHGHGIAPLSELLAAGVPVALGTDSVVSCGRLDLLDEARVAVLLQRARTRNAEAIPAGTTIELATIRAAAVLGLETEIGSLERGKSADLAAFALSAPGSSDPVTALLYSGTERRASFVTVAGRVLVSEGRVLHDSGALRERVAAAAAALAASRTSEAHT